MTQELLGRVYRELLDVLKSINQDEIHHDGDDFHELLSDVKEALAQTQEPFAYVNVEKRRLEFASPYVKWDTPTTIKLDKIPLYTHPPQRTWVGLTDEEVADCMDMSIQKTCRAIEAKLKEKNT